MTAFALAYETVGDAAAPRAIAILHGIFGAGRNWRSFAHRWVATHPDSCVVLPDLRAHGGSLGAPPPHDLAACADDLERLSAHLGRPFDVLAGHSFGGKVAATLAARRPPGVGALWLLDCPPGALDGGADPGQSEAGRVLATLRGLPRPLRRRATAAEALEEAGVDQAVSRWMATNLAPSRQDEGTFTWRFDLEAVAALLADYWRTDAWPLLAQAARAMDVTVVRAGRSDRWSPAERARLAAEAERGALRHLELPEAAHWLHIDDPEGLLGLMSAGPISPA